MYLMQRLSLQSASIIMTAIMLLCAGNGVVPAAIQDPFLQRLVRKDVITAKKVGQKAKELMKDAPAVEQQLMLRAESTKEHLARLFELQEGYQERLTTFLRTAAQSIGQAELIQQVSCYPTLITVNLKIHMHKLSSVGPQMYDSHPQWSQTKTVHAHLHVPK